MQELIDLGLTKNESKVFRSLIKVGKASSSIVSRESGVPYGRIYGVLDSLEQKGLVKVIPEKGKRFVPADPSALMELLNQKKMAMKRIAEEIGKLRKIYDIREKEPVEVARGKKSFYKLMRQLPKPRRSQFSVKYASEYNPEWVRDERLALKRGVEIKHLVRFDKETEKNVKKWLGIHKNIRKIPNDGVSITLVDESMILITLIRSNIQLLIRDAAFLKLMKEIMGKYYSGAGSI